MKPLVIVGASHAGVQLAASARELGFAAPIVLLGDEPHAPYQRPPLSKGFLTGKASEDQLSLRSPAFYADERIELRTGVRVASFDPSLQRVTLQDGSTLDYGWLALCTGAACRRLAVPGADLAGIHDLRSLADARALAFAATDAQCVCVIGGGYIGLEAAAAMRALGKEVTVVQGSARLLTRSMPPLMAAYVERVHASRGVKFRKGQGVRAILGEQGRAVAVELADGTRVHADLVVLGIGVTPNTGLAAQAGLAVSNGIEVDGMGRTSAPQVLAVGDVACMQLPQHGRVRLESIQAAVDGAKATAATLVGRQQPCTAVPWFWSDQFHLKLQMAGLAAHDDVPVVRGDMATDKFSVAYLRHGVLAAMHSVNSPAEHMLARKLVAARVRTSARDLTDPSFDLKRLLAPAAVAA